MTDNLTSIAIVTPVHNRREITLQCLRSLSRINRSGMAIHVVIVDDGSTDGTSEAIHDQFPDVEIVAGDGNLWFTEGTNVGVRAALTHDPKYILMMNDDSVFDEEFLQFLVETAEKNNRSVVGPLLLLWDTPHRLFQTAPIWDTWSGGWRHWQNQTVWSIPDRPWKVDLIVGNCLLIPAEAIREVGLMDSARYPNFGDAEYTSRMKKKGWELLIEPRARVFCQPNTLPPRIRHLGIGKIVNALFFDLGHIYNLRRRFYATVDGAPSKLQGVIAFFVFFCRAVVGRNAESASRIKNRAEMPLSEYFSRSVVDEQ